MLRKGWIINLSRPDENKEVERDQPPAITLDDGDVVFEVWFWHSLLRRWFVMSYSPIPALVAQGVVFFAPDEVPERLKARMQLIELQHGINR